MKSLPERINHTYVYSFHHYRSESINNFRWAEDCICMFYSTFFKSSAKTPDYTLHNHDLNGNINIIICSFGRVSAWYMDDFGTETKCPEIKRPETKGLEGKASRDIMSQRQTSNMLHCKGQTYHQTRHNRSQNLPINTRVDMQKTKTKKRWISHIPFHLKCNYAEDSPKNFYIITLSRR
jgi:hypothetical protein